MDMEGWLEHHKTVHKKLDQLNEQMTIIRIEIAMLKVKSGVWGLIGGLIPVVIILAFELLKK